eukprot:1520779-Alexandrium_andersonii.AAC.1
MSASLVGSEMCIRDSLFKQRDGRPRPLTRAELWALPAGRGHGAAETRRRLNHGLGAEQAAA